MIADRVISLPDVIARALDLRLAHTHVALPAKIVSFDPVTQLAQVKPLLQEVEEHEDGTETASPIPVLIDVPVQFPGGNNFVLSFPVVPGDYCMVVFQDRSIDSWLDSGGDVDPQDARRHHLSDAVALLGVRPLPSSLVTFDTDRAYLGHVGTTSSDIGVAVANGVVHLGVAPNNAATDAVALASIVDADLAELRSKLNALTTAHNTHIHPVAGVLAGAATVPSSVTTTTATAPGTMNPTGSAVVKSD